MSAAFSKRELTCVHVRYMHIARPSVCHLSVCLSFATFVHPTQAIEIFGNVSTPLGKLAIH